MKVKQSSEVYDAVQYQPGIEDGFMNLLQWETGEYHKVPYVILGGYRTLISETDWLIYCGGVLRWVRVDAEFKREFECDKSITER